MRVKELETVVLDRDLPEHGLREGDFGAVVQVYSPENLEVEFVTASGRTQALVSLSASDVRPVSDEDLPGRTYFVAYWPAPGNWIMTGPRPVPRSGWMPGSRARGRRSVRGRSPRSRGSRAPGSRRGARCRRGSALRGRRR